jgi:hypothetical protein
MSNSRLKIVTVLQDIWHLFLSSLILSTFTAGYWMVEQTMNAVIHFRRDFVNLPYYDRTINVWLYHDIAYTLLWISYIVSVLTEVKNDRLHVTGNLILVAIIGFALLTAGLWLTQDTMVAVLSYNRAYVDLPFFALQLDLYNIRDSARLLTFLGFLTFYTIKRR